MADFAVCAALVAGLLFLYWYFGRLLLFLTKGRAGAGLCMLCGAFVYHSSFQALALPLILLRKPLSWLSLSWLAVLACALILGAAVTARRKRETADSWSVILRKAVFGTPPGRDTSGQHSGTGEAGRYTGKMGEKRAFSWITALMLILAAAQLYYIVTNDYLGWDTTYYVGTVGTSVSTNSMYCFDGESGWGRSAIDLRYALSSFYIHSAVWCQLLKIPAIVYAKLVQGGVLGVLANVAVYELGIFLFSGARYKGFIKRERIPECAAGMVIAAILLNFFYQSAYTTSDFLLNRALEAKSYCANLILPLVFLLGLDLWRQPERREIRISLFTVMLGSVAVSMSALLTAPALLTAVYLPVFWKKRSWKNAGYYLLCILPNAAYLAAYLLCG